MGQTHVPRRVGSIPAIRLSLSLRLRLGLGLLLLLYSHLLLSLCVMCHSLCVESRLSRSGAMLRQEMRRVPLRDELLLLQLMLLLLVHLLILLCGDGLSVGHDYWGSLLEHKLWLRREL